MKQFGKTAALLAGAIVMITGIGFLAYIVYRNITVEQALSEAQQFELGKPPATHRGDPQALQVLRPHPWSSPLNDRRFDEAIAGASAAYESGDYNRAIALNTKALEIHPSKDLVWLLLIRRGNCYLANNQPDKALADYEQAAHLGELDARTYVNRAFALRREGKQQESVKDFEAAIASSPNDPVVYLNRAAAFAEDGELNKALSDYTKALELNPRITNARLAYAQILLRQRESQKAITQSTIVLKIDAHSALAYIIRARAYAQLRMNSDASSSLDTATKLNPKNMTTLNAVAWCRATCAESALRSGGKAVAEAAQACELDQWKHWAYVDTLAAAYAETGDFEQAVKYQQQALEMAPAENQDVSDMKKRLELYKHHTAFRDNPNRL